MRLFVEPLYNQILLLSRCVHLLACWLCSARVSALGLGETGLSVSGNGGACLSSCFFGGFPAVVLQSFSVPIARQLLHPPWLRCRGRGSDICCLADYSLEIFTEVFHVVIVDD